MLVIGSDIGTSAVKTVIMDNCGHIAAEDKKSYPIYTYNDGRVEQNTNDWWNSFKITLENCLKKINGDELKNLSAISISAQGGSTAPFDKNLKPSGPALVWMDSRAKDIAVNFDRTHGRDFIYKKNGWRNGSGLSISHIMWMLENGFNSENIFSTTLDYINYKLTGNFIIDTTCAAMTGLSNFKSADWDDETLSEINLNRSSLAQVKPAGSFIGNIKNTDLSINGLPVYCGAHDQYCCAAGAGVNEDGKLLVATGTAWVVLSVLEHEVFDEKYASIFPCRHINNKSFGMMSSIPCGGASLNWFNENISDKKISLAQMDKKAEGRIFSDKSLFVYPYFSGSGLPDFDLTRKADIKGLTLGHDRYDLHLAIMESVAFELLGCINHYKKAGIKNIDEVIMTGGASKSPLWRKIIAAILNKKIKYMSFGDFAPVGAAMIAGVGCGIWKDYNESSEKFINSNGGYKEEIPDKNLVSYYKDKYRGYKQKR